MEKASILTRADVRLGLRAGGASVYVNPLDTYANARLGHSDEDIQWYKKPGDRSVPLCGLPVYLRAPSFLFSLPYNARLPPHRHSHCSLCACAP